jgi:hypothetical protein
VAMEARQRRPVMNRPTLATRAQGKGRRGFTEPWQSFQGELGFQWCSADAWPCAMASSGALGTPTRSAPRREHGESRDYI